LLRGGLRAIEHRRGSRSFAPRVLDISPRILELLLYLERASARALESLTDAADLASEGCVGGRVRPRRWWRFGRGCTWRLRLCESEPEVADLVVADEPPRGDQLSGL
jgi:hypothetical protein